jgi:hypothetical protein
LAAAIADRRDPSRVVHPPADILHARIFANACGQEDADGAPEEIRTPDPQIRSLVLYPAELRALAAAGRQACASGL